MKKICTIIIVSIMAAVLVLGIITVCCSCSTSPQNKERDAWICAQDVVSNQLKSPSTADFCRYSEATIIDLGNNRYKIEGYVDAQNGFGAIIRSYFTVTLTLTDSGYKDAKCNIY